MPRDAGVRKGAACSAEGCDSPATFLLGERLLCEEHAAGYRCSVEGCDCWADAAIAGRPVCRHHLVEHRFTRRTKRGADPASGSPAV